MAERVLTLRELNRATLARQLLLERKRALSGVVLEPFAPLPRTVQRELEDEAGRLEAFLAD